MEDHRLRTALLKLRQGLMDWNVWRHGVGFDDTTNTKAEPRIRGLIADVDAMIKEHCGPPEPQPTIADYQQLRADVDSLVECVSEMRSGLGLDELRVVAAPSSKTEQPSARQIAILGVVPADVNTTFPFMGTLWEHTGLQTAAYEIVVHLQVTAPQSWTRFTLAQYLASCRRRGFTDDFDCAVKTLTSLARASQLTTTTVGDTCYYAVTTRFVGALAAAGYVR